MFCPTASDYDKIGKIQLTEYSVSIHLLRPLGMLCASRFVMGQLRAVACGPGRRSTRVMLGHACETTYLQREPPITENQSPTHRTQSIGRHNMAVTSGIHISVRTNPFSDFTASDITTVSLRVWLRLKSFIRITKLINPVFPFWLIIEDF